MTSRLRILVALGALAVAMPAALPAGVTVGPGGGTPGTAQNFQLVGHHSLFGRGMNAAPTIYDHYLYVGNRTDGSSRCGVGDPRRAANLDSCPHTNPGVQILDIADPSKPTVVGEIGPPHASQVGITTRELRVWPQRKLLMIMTFRCSSAIHACPPGTDATFPFDIKFFDLDDPVNPRFITSYVPVSQAGVAVKPHEMFLWIDPKDGNRALLWLSLPTISTSPRRPNLMIVDISDLGARHRQREQGRTGVATVAEGNWNQLFPGTSSPGYNPPTCDPYDCNLALHSMTPSTDGTRTYLAYLAGHFAVLDTSAVVRAGRRGEVISLNDKLLTDPATRPTWDPPEVHSAIRIPGRPFALTTEELYGKLTAPTHGCPWGWVKLLDVAQPQRPQVVGEYKLTENEGSFCGSARDDPQTEQATSYASHNPTLLPNLALMSWHSGGLQAIDISNPRQPAQAGWFSPTPLPAVATDDPALSRGPNKVVVWSFPIIKDGLIYVVDIRNGLYVLRYTGPGADAVSRIKFLEGNSNLGDAVALDQPGPP